MTTYKSVKYNISGADLTGLTAGQIPNLDTAKVTTGTFADARISASSVTAHASDYIAWQSVVTASTLTAVAGRGYPINTTSNACTVTLPASASVGDLISIVDYAGTFATNNITLTSSLNIEGGTSNKILTTNREGVVITYVDVTQGWVATTGVNSGDQAIDPIQYSVEYLVVAGGGAGANNQYHGGGGGAGGYRTNFGGSAYTFNAGVVYTCTVGTGGTIPSPGGNSLHTSGVDSTLSGSNITDITSTGGGRGMNEYASPAIAAATGGSGGGGGAYGGAGAAGNTPSTSPSQGSAGGTGSGGSGNGGGGGGASSAGSGATGGNGTANSITGSSITYAGGGGGGFYPSGSASGGSGGGGAGSHADGSPGTDGLGGGGGSSERNGSNAGGIGGDGVVILRMLTTDYSGTTTGSPTVTTDGLYKVIKFTATGSYTA